MNVLIVPMDITHIEDIVAIEKTSFSRPWTKEQISEELNNPSSHFLVAVSGGETVGYMGVNEICSEAYISNIAVKNSYRQKGIGSALLKAALDGASERKNEFITLEVRPSNRAAIRLYEKFGFEPVGKRKNYYENPVEDALLMTRILNT